MLPGRQRDVSWGRWNGADHRSRCRAYCRQYVDRETYPIAVGIQLLASCALQSASVLREIMKTSALVLSHHPQPLDYVTTWS